MHTHAIQIRVNHVIEEDLVERGGSRRSRHCNPTSRKGVRSSQKQTPMSVNSVPITASLWLVVSIGRSSLAADLDSFIGNTRTSRYPPERQASRPERSNAVQVLLRYVIHCPLWTSEELNTMPRSPLTRVTLRASLVSSAVFSMTFGVGAAGSLRPLVKRRSS